MKYTSIIMLQFNLAAIQDRYGMTFAVIENDIGKAILSHAHYIYVYFINYEVALQKITLTIRLSDYNDTIVWHAGTVSLVHLLVAKDDQTNN